MSKYSDKQEIEPAISTGVRRAVGTGVSSVFLVGSAIPGIGPVFGAFGGIGLIGTGSRVIYDSIKSTEVNNELDRTKLITQITNNTNISSKLAIDKELANTKIGQYAKEFLYQPSSKGQDISITNPFTKRVKGAVKWITKNVGRLEAVPYIPLRIIPFVPGKKMNESMIIDNKNKALVNEQLKALRHNNNRVLENLGNGNGLGGASNDYLRYIESLTRIQNRVIKHLAEQERTNPTFFQDITKKHLKQIFDDRVEALVAEDKILNEKNLFEQARDIGSSLKNANTKGRSSSIEAFNSALEKAKQSIENTGTFHSQGAHRWDRVVDNTKAIAEQARGGIKNLYDQAASKLHKFSDKMHGDKEEKELSPAERRVIEIKREYKRMERIAKKEGGEAMDMLENISRLLKEAEAELREEKMYKAKEQVTKTSIVSSMKNKTRLKSNKLFNTSRYSSGKKNSSTRTDL